MQSAAVEKNNYFSALKLDQKLDFYITPAPKRPGLFFSALKAVI